MESRYIDFRSIVQQGLEQEQSQSSNQGSGNSLSILVLYSQGTSLLSFCEEKLLT